MLGNSFTILDSIDSTNNYATAQATQGFAKHGAAFMTLNQTAGKGQRGKQWQSESGKNIAITLLLDMSGTAISSQFALNMAVALGTWDLFSKYALDETKIKWPNDIYWRDRKAVGILIENVISGQNWQWAVAGIGINVNQTNFETVKDKTPVSLKQITGKDFDCVFLAKELCIFLDKRFQQFKENKFEELLKCYNENLYRKGILTKFKYQETYFESAVKQIDQDGKLWLDNAPKPFFTFGEVEWVV